MNQEELRALLRSGIEAAQNNSTILARSTFRDVLAEDPNNELAWMWLAQVVDTDDQRREALQNVVRINPNNARAKEALQRLTTSTSRAMPNTAVSRESYRPTTQQQKPLFVPKEGKTQHPDGLWGSKGSSRSSDNTRTLTLLTLGILGMLLIAGAIYLLIDRTTLDADELANENATSTAAVLTREAVVVVVDASPTSNVPTRTPITTVEVNTPPPTFTPLPPPTETPVPTATTPPQQPSTDFSVLFADSAAGLTTVSGDGADVNTLNLDLATASIVQVFSPSYARSGDLVAFIGETSDGIREVFVGNLDTNEVRQITDLNQSQTWDASWSPDGRFIVFSSNVDGDFDLYLVNVDGGTPTKIVGQREINETQPAISPDGNYLAYAAGPINGLNTEIYLIPLENPAMVCQMTDANRSSFAPAWSPDGSRLAFLSNRDSRGSAMTGVEETDLYVMNKDGSVEVSLSFNDGTAMEYAPSWSPDGRFVAVISDRTLAGVDDVTPPATPDEEGNTPPAPTVNRVWLVDVDNIIWYPVAEVANTSNTYFAPDPSQALPDDIGFACAAGLPAVDESADEEPTEAPLPTATLEGEATVEGETAEGTPADDAVEATPAAEETPTG